MRKRVVLPRRQSNQKGRTPTFDPGLGLPSVGFGDRRLELVRGICGKGAYVLGPRFELVVHPVDCLREREARRPD